MFEFEAGVRRVDSPLFYRGGPDLESFLKAKIRRRCRTVWQEHCSECAMPECYSTCSFYSPRADYKCRRFPSGVAILPPTQNAGAPMLIRFGRWARLLGYGPTPLDVPHVTAQKERSALRIAQAMDRPSSLRGLLAPVRRRIVNNRSETEPWAEAKNTDLYLIIEAMNDGTTPVALSLSCKVLDVPSADHRTHFRSMLSFDCGYSVKAVPVSYFLPEEFIGRRFAMELAPANEGETPQIAFGLIDIAELDREPSAELLIPDSRPPSVSDALPKIKCVVWDLDNTLWEGVLIEDGLEKLRLRPEVVSAIRTLDSKGILQSIASKNDPQDALAALAHFGLSEYFIHPQISWAPKSASITAIRDRLNIGMDTFAFVDDQKFEQSEVLSQHPEILMIDAYRLEELGTNVRFDVEVSVESAARRKLYQAEAQRVAALSTSSGSYEDFLKTCNLRMEIADLVESDLVRASELAQRTNQLNIGTSRYTVEQLRRLLEQQDTMRVLTVRATDKFGSYGLVGLCVIDEAEVLILDLMFSCRIQGKLIDDAFVAWLGQQYSGASKVLQARFNPTKKNAPAKDLLKRTGFAFQAEGSRGEIWSRTDTPRTLADLGRIIEIGVPPDRYRPGRVHQDSARDVAESSSSMDDVL